MTRCRMDRRRHPEPWIADDQRRGKRGSGEEADETTLLRSDDMELAHDNLLLLDCTPDRGARSEVITLIYSALLHL